MDDHMRELVRQALIERCIHCEQRVKPPFCDMAITNTPPEVIFGDFGIDMAHEELRREGVSFPPLTEREKKMVRLKTWFWGKNVRPVMCPNRTADQLMCITRDVKD